MFVLNRFSPLWCSQGASWENWAKRKWNRCPSQHRTGADRKSLPLSIAPLRTGLSCPPLQTNQGWESLSPSRTAVWESAPGSETHTQTPWQYSFPSGNTLSVLIMPCNARAIDFIIHIWNISLRPFPILSICSCVLLGCWGFFSSLNDDEWFLLGYDLMQEKPSVTTHAHPLYIAYSHTALREKVYLKIRAKVAI